MNDEYISEMLGFSFFSFSTVWHIPGWQHIKRYYHLGHNERERKNVIYQNRTFSFSVCLMIIRIKIWTENRWCKAAAPLPIHTCTHYVCTSASVSLTLFYRQYYHHRIEWKPQLTERMVENDCKFFDGPEKTTTTSTIIAKLAWLTYIVFVGIVFFLSLSPIIYGSK